jgi:hypothetical protein
MAGAVAFVAGTGGAMRGESLSSEPALALNWVAGDASESGAIHDVIETPNRGTGRRMPRPFFAADGDHLLYSSRGRGDRLRARDPRRSREGDLFTNEDAEEIAPFA